MAETWVLIPACTRETSSKGLQWAFMSERLGLIFSGESSYLNVVFSLVLLIYHLLSSPLFWGWGVLPGRGLMKGILKYSNEAQWELPDPELQLQTSVSEMEECGGDE